MPRRHCILANLILWAVCLSTMLSPLSATNGSVPAAARSPYTRLRLQALAAAKSVAHAKDVNPGILPGGLDPDKLAALREQDMYLEEHRFGGSEKKSTSVGFLSKYPSFAPNSVPARSCKTASVHAVNGRETGVVFTPQSPHNFYKIEGCLFGQVRGQVQLEPHPDQPGQSALPILLRVEDSARAWTDHEINAVLDPHITGLSDTPVTLVIYPGKGERVELPGGFFVARRGERRLLGSIPSAWVKLQASKTNGRPIQQLEYVSPAETHPARHRASAMVIRSDNGQFGSGTDLYDFTHLNPGWAIESVQIDSYSVACPGDVIEARRIGNWTTLWDQRGFRVNWQEDECKSYVPPSLTFNLCISHYTARVWVVGPVGTEPISK